MKNLMLVLLLILSAHCFGQDVNKEVDKRIDDRVGGIINVKIDSFAKTLEAVLYRTRTITGTQNIDTLTAPLNFTKTYRITLDGQDRGGSKDVTISNNNGTYFIRSQKQSTNYSGPTGTSFTVVFTNNRVLVVVTSPTASLYEYKKY